MLRIILATRNTHKFRELTALLRVPGIRWESLEAVPNAPDVRETGRTLEANAIKKARALAEATGRLALADDSGLEVDALSGEPGVRSARYAGRHGDDPANNAKLLQTLRGVSRAKRGAQYRCVLALAAPGRVVGVAQGVWRGRIAEQSVGTRGFGYDPIFFVPKFGKTVGQLPASTKNRLSHRGQAARRMQRLLGKLVALLPQGIEQLPQA